MWVNFVLLLFTGTLSPWVSLSQQAVPPVYLTTENCECSRNIILNIESIAKMEPLPQPKGFPNYSPPPSKMWLHQFLFEKVERQNKELARRIYKKNEKMPLWLKVIDLLSTIRIKTKFYWGKISLHTLKVDAQIYLIF